MTIENTKKTTESSTDEREPGQDTPETNLTDRDAESVKGGKSVKIEYKPQNNKDGSLV